MPKFAANLSMMFTEVEFLDRFAAAADAGFKAVEYLFPYEYAAAELAAKLADHGLEQALFNMPPGDWAAGERGISALPGREQEFEQSVTTALRYAEALHCPKLHCMAGLVVGDPDEQLELYVDNLRYVADRAAEQGVLIVIEPLNPYATPNYLLDSIAMGCQVLDLVDRDNVKLQFDFFHAQQTDGDITHSIRQLIDRIGHVQLASVPDRHEPDSGELFYPWVLGVLDDAGYDGWVGCEYNPAGDTVAGLGWLDMYREPNA